MNISPLAYLGIFFLCIALCKAILALVLYFRSRRH